MGRIKKRLLRPAAALAATWLALSCAGGTNDPSPTAPGSGAKTVTIMIKDNSFEPRSVTIQAGDTVRWVLQGSAPDHTVTAENGTFDSGFVFANPGAAYERQFTLPNQTIDYSCRAHKDCCNMRGAIQVGAATP